jgi:hypothetical protein
MSRAMRGFEPMSVAPVIAGDVRRSTGIARGRRAAGPAIMHRGKPRDTCELGVEELIERKGPLA